MRVALLHSNAKVPTRATPGSAGFDLYACEPAVLKPGARALIPTGVAIEPDAGWYGRIAPRSGLAVKYGIHILAGVIDSDYRDGISVAAVNLGDQPWEIRPGDRIAQLVLEWHYRGPVERVLVLSETERGTKGFGSTGV